MIYNGDNGLLLGRLYFHEIDELILKIVFVHPVQLLMLLVHDFTKNWIDINTTVINLL